MKTEDQIDTLNQLLRGELAATETYQQAMAKVGSEPGAAELRQIHDEHRDARHDPHPWRDRSHRHVVFRRWRHRLRMDAGDRSALAFRVGSAQRVEDVGHRLISPSASAVRRCRWRG